MELEGLKRSLTVIKNQDMQIQTLATDRHTGIKKYMREQENDIDHRFDCWHMATGMLYRGYWSYRNSNANDDDNDDDDYY